MNLEKKNVHCPICGGTEYVKDIGYYYCSECQTQSQELREEVFEAKCDASGLPLNASWGTKVTVKDKKKKKSDDCETWTTWEAYNFILRGQVEELLSLGASERYKYTVLQLWAYYLKKLEVAFTCETKHALPKMGPSFHRKDRDLVYGTPAATLRKNIRKYRRSVGSRHSLSGVSSVTDEASSKKLYRKSKKVLMELEKEQLSQSFKSSVDQSSTFKLTDSDSDLSSASSTVRSLRRTHYNGEALRVLKRLRKKKKVKPTTNILTKSRLLHYTNPNSLSRFRLLVLLYLALLCSGEKIQLSDILRWTREGNLAYYEISHLLPGNLCIKGSDQQVFSSDIYLPSYANFEKSAHGMAKLLDITDWIRPNLLDIASRFLKELQLPGMLLTLMERFLVTAPFLSDWDHLKPPNYEGRVVAIIIVILKLLLGLDGKTEGVISSTASKINRLRSRREHLPQLFVWNDWVQYILCRKALVTRYHFPTRDNIAPDVYLKSQIYVDCWEQLRKKHGPSKVLFTEGVNPVLVDSMKRSFLKLERLDTIQHKEFYLPASLTPYNSCAKRILSFLPIGEEANTRKILSQDFTSSDIQYLLRPAVFQNSAETVDIKVHVKRRSAQCKLRNVKKIFQKPEENHMTFNRKLVSIHVVEERKDSHRTKRNFLNKGSDDILHGNLNNSSKKKSKRGESQSVEEFSGMCKRKRSVEEAPALKLNGDASCKNLCIQDEGEENTVKQMQGEKTRFLHTNGSKFNDSEQVLFESSDCITGKHRLCEDAQTAVSGLCNSTVNEVSMVSDSTVICAQYSSNSSIKSYCEIPEKTVHLCCRSLPNEAGMLLYKYLGMSQRRECKVLSGNKTSLYLSYPQYWMLQRSVIQMDERTFERKILRKLPLSFSWLLTECAQMLEMSKRELYREIFHVESLCTDILGVHQDV